MTERDIVIMSVDRSQPDVIVVNTAVDFLHCPLRLPKATLRQLGYTVYRPQKLKPLVHALVFREYERLGQKVPLGGITLDPDDVEGLPFNPVSSMRPTAGNGGGNTTADPHA